jgi:FKBP-type peptidyl-prolyl cis-trans isomerase
VTIARRPLLLAALAAPLAAPLAWAQAVLPTVPRTSPITPEGNAAFLAAYAARPDVKKLPGGTMYRVLHAAPAGAIGPINRSDSATCSYRGWLINGTIFNETKPGAPVAFTLSVLIPGWRDALLKMKVGDLWELVIPADQAYGAEGHPPAVPPNQTLVFVVSMAAVAFSG